MGNKRDGSEGNEALVKLLDEKRNTPFSEKRIQMWIDRYNEEVNFFFAKNMVGLKQFWPNFASV